MKGILINILDTISRNLGASVLTGISILIVIGLSVKQGVLYNALIYIGCLLAAVLLTELIFNFQNKSFPAWTIKSLNKELWILLFCIAMALGLKVIRFFIIEDFSSLPGYLKMLLLVFRFLFIFPLLLFGYLKFSQKYKFWEIGFGIRGLGTGILISALFGITALFFIPEKLQFKSVLEQHGYIAFVTLGFLTAAIPEEFIRLITQTRFSKLFNSVGLGWYLASLIWALSHIPFFYAQGGSITTATIGAIGILPMGLFWGYLTERFKSIIPTVIVHGLNLWGLQNIF